MSLHPSHLSPPPPPSARVPPGRMAAMRLSERKSKAVWDQAPAHPPAHAPHGAKRRPTPPPTRRMVPMRLSELKSTAVREQAPAHPPAHAPHGACEAQ